MFWENAFEAIYQRHNVKINVIIQRISETFNKKCIFIEKHSHFILTNTRKLECANEMMCGVYSLLAVMFDSKIRQLSIK